MGWASAGYTIFEPVMKALQKAKADDETRKQVAGELIKALRDGDWDTEDESLERFADDTAIVAAFAENEVYLPGTPEYKARWGD